ncbi:MAG TPA: nuclear transport factor 2 family protein [Roseiarcus sp.]
MSTQIEVDPVQIDRAFATEWYADGWIDCWNSNRPERVRELLTEDFVLDSPTTRHTGWHVQGHEATMAYIRYVLTAYPDLKWEVTAPPMFSDNHARAAFTWRGTGHFSGRIDPPGIEGNGRGFEFSGLEVFDFRGNRASRLYATYDLLGLMKQIGLYRGATAR